MLAKLAFALLGSILTSSWALAAEPAPEHQACAIGPLMAEAAPPPVPGPCAGIRPGGQLANGCTLAFVWEATTDGDRDLYVGTAGHCIGPGDRATLASGLEFGVAVMSRNGGVGNDVALIHVDEALEHEVDPQLCHWGGPTKTWSAATPAERANALLYHYGNGVHTMGHDALKPRLGLSTRFDSGVQFVGALSGGDSGSPVMMSNGVALGIATAAIIVDPGAPVRTFGPVGFGTGVQAAEVYAQRDLGLTLTLVTAPLA